MPARTPKTPAPTNAYDRIETAVAELVAASRDVASINQLSIGAYRLQFSGGELLSLSAR